jgi:hypothetical protein
MVNQQKGQQLNQESQNVIAKWDNTYLEYVERMAYIDVLRVDYH